MESPEVRATDVHAVAAFCHIPKTAGLQVARLLQRCHGARHLAVQPRHGHLYQAADLRFDLRLHRGVTSLAGHSLRPFIDYGTDGERLRWYTLLRDPVDRYLSHFMQEVATGRTGNDLAAWVRTSNRANFQVRMLAGAEDLESAKASLRRMAVVGFVEDLPLSLVMIRESFGWATLELGLANSVNVSSGHRRDEVRAAAEPLTDEVLEKNQLDLALHDYARTELWPKQLARFEEDRVVAVAATALPAATGLRPSLNRLGYLVRRHGAQRPSAVLRRKITRA